MQRRPAELQAAAQVREVGHQLEARQWLWVGQRPYPSVGEPGMLEEQRQPVELQTAVQVPERCGRLEAYGRSGVFRWLGVGQRPEPPYQPVEEPGTPGEQRQLVEPETAAA